MNEGWQFVLNEAAFECFLSSRLGDRRELLRCFEALCANPYQEADYRAQMENGRPVYLKSVGHFLVTFWPDSGPKEIRIIQIERL